MTGDKIRLLSKAKKLIKSGKRRFQIRPDRDYLQELAAIGITESYAWEIILSLNVNDFFIDYKPDGEALVFKRKINNEMVYIKIKIENGYNMEEEVVCISFHIDHK